MSDGIYEIIKDAVKKQNVGTAEGEEIIAAYERMAALNDIARKEGLLALEDEMQKMVGQEKDDAFDDYFYGNLTGVERLLAALISLIVDGTDPQIVERVAVSRYFASDFEGQTAVAACMVIIGALAIRAGESPQILKKEMLAMMPEEVENIVMAKEKDRAGKEKGKTDIPEDFFQGEISGTENSPTLRGFAQLTATMEDPSIQRVLREVDTQILGICLKGANGQTRKRFFDNMSGRVALMVYEDVCYMGPVRLIDVETAAVKIMNVIKTLEEQGEITMRSSALAGRTVEDMIALQEHKILCQNREIEYKIMELKAEISKLEMQIVKL